MTSDDGIPTRSFRALGAICAALLLAGFAAQRAEARPVNVCADLSPFGGIQTIYTVPADRWLAIDHSTVKPRDLLEPGEIVQVTVLTTANGVEGTYFAGRASGDEFGFAADGRTLNVYADKGTDVRIAISIRNYTGQVGICLSGRLLPLWLGGN